MPHASQRSGSAHKRAPFPLWNRTPSAEEGVDLPSTTYGAPGAPAIDNSTTGIDELAFLLATDHLSTLEKISLLEQWRYDMLLLDVAAGEGLGSTRDDGALLQQVNKALLLLAATYPQRH
jgi:hypothetical protein